MKFIDNKLRKIENWTKGQQTWENRLSGRDRKRPEETGTGYSLIVQEKLTVMIE